MRLCFLRAAWSAILLLHAAFFVNAAHAQAPKTWSSSEILLGLKKLNVLGSALYLAAHPDDENTRLIAYLANGRLVETGYLSCTRGDGGQNLIGPELREQLGVIRTQELLAARRIDGGRQFFTRANDFGFSKTPEETFTIWDKEQVLADMVWVIRQRRPDVLITRFPPDARAGHGHHTASALLAIEAFSAAADPKRFPEQLQYVQPWQAKRLVWNTGSFFVKPGENMDGYLKLDAGGYNPLLGQSYGEIAARSRSQHKSQGFGSAATRGEALEYFQLLKGEPAKTDLFEGVDMTWNRVPGGAAVGKLIDEVIRKYDPSNPSASVAGLLKVREELHGYVLEDRGIVRHMKKSYYARVEKYNNEHSFSTDLAVAAQQKLWFTLKEDEVSNLIAACSGLSIEALVSVPTIATGQKIDVRIEAVNRSILGVGMVSVRGPIYRMDTSLTDTGKLLKDKLVVIARQLIFDRSVDPSNPYWLRLPGSIGMYRVPTSVLLNTDAVRQQRYGGRLDRDTVARQSLIGRAENPAVASIKVRVEIYPTVNHVTFDYLGRVDLTIPVQYKSTDPVEGEKYRPLTVVPPVAVNIGGRAYVFADTQPKTVPVTLRAGKAGVKGTLALNLPKGWKAEPGSISFELAAKDADQTVYFQVQPGAGAAEGKAELRAVATVDGQPYTRGIQTIQYNHIPTQTLFPEAVAPLVKLNLQRKGQEIGYLMGAGDEVPDALRQVGYTVTLLKPEDLIETSLRRFDAVVLGIRAYNTVDELKTRQPALLKYAENGGNVVVQYVVNRGTVLPEIGPYPLTLGRDRVTVEDAPVTLLNSKQPLLNTPNRISPQDFTGWVQEQGLYYPEKWDPRYQTVISSHDPGEPARESAILVADYGKGHYIYTGLSFFRELPAGVPGAYRLLTNMVSLGK